MSTKVKIIVTAILVIAVIVSIVCVYVYINHLNKKITDLSITVENQVSLIDSLHCQIDSLEKDVSSVHDTLNITNEYLDKVKNAYSNESYVKQQIYEEVISDQQTQEWFDEKLPDNIINLINTASNDGMCKDSI